MRVIVEMLSYPFLVRAFVGGIFVSLCASLLGVSLVLKRYSMIGDGLSHVSFGALSVAIAAGWSPLAVSIPVVVLAASAADYGKREIKERCGDCHDFGKRTCHRYSGHFDDYRDDDGYQQLYVWEHPCHASGGSGVKPDSLRSCAGFVCILLP